MPLRLRHLALATLLISLFTATAAQAAITASYTPRNYFNGQEEFPNEYIPASVELTADDAANALSVAKAGKEQVTISDPAGVSAGNGCTQTSASSVTCPLPDYVLATLAGGADSLTGGQGVTLVAEGGTGNDTITGYGGPVFGEGVDSDSGGVVLDGGDGDDVLTGTNVDLSGGPGDDTLTAAGTEGVGLAGGAGKDELTGGVGRDDLYGGPDADDLKGGDGNDTLDGDGYGALDSDDLDGGAGTDTLDWSTRTGAVTISLENPGPDGEQGEKDKLMGIENVATGSGADTITGSNAAERIAPGAGADTVAAGGGDDFLDDGGDEVSDSLDLGAGSDTISYLELGEGTVEVDLSDPGPDGPAEGKDTLTAVENVIGTLNLDSNRDIDGSDHLVGDAGPNVLVGLGGPDRLEGGAGDDSLYGENRRQDGNVDLSYPANDRLSGGDGNDLLDGGIDSDRMDGGAGADRFDGEGFDREPRDAFSVDVVDYSSRTAPITAKVGSGGGEAGEGDTYSGIEAIRGGRGKDKLTGRRKKADRLFGGRGADVLDALSGKDRVSGGAGRDRITANDGQRDKVDCGAGRDRVEADKKDRLTACERRLSRRP